jgi:hypothetical protein
MPKRELQSPRNSLLKNAPVKLIAGLSAYLLIPYFLSHAFLFFPAASGRCSQQRAGTHRSFGSSPGTGSNSGAGHYCPGQNARGQI